MSTLCCVTGCSAIASWRQPLKLGTELELHVPLCDLHNSTWEAFATRLNKSRDGAKHEARDTGWLLDAALALALFPPSEPI